MSDTINSRKLSLLDKAMAYAKIIKPLTPQRLSTLESYKKHGVTRNQVASMMVNLFHYPANFRDTLEHYYILHWTGKHFDSILEEGAIFHADSGFSYLVVYQGCTPYAARRAKQLKLSFRKASVDFGLQAYVIVRTIQDSE